MNRRTFLRQSSIAATSVLLTPMPVFSTENPIRKLAAFSALPTIPQWKYLCQWIDKTNPKVCLITTASADNPDIINRVYDSLIAADLKPYSLRTCAISSNSQRVSWDESLAQADIICIAGGNTLNMLAIWQAQEIDKAIVAAYQKGTLIVGNSAGANCWYEQSISDARPIQLSVIQGLGILKGSFCPHLNSEPKRKPAIEQFLANQTLIKGYATDNGTGILYQDENTHQYITSSIDNKIYEYEYIDNQVIIKPIPTKTI